MATTQRRYRFSAYTTVFAAAAIAGGCAEGSIDDTGGFGGLDGGFGANGNGNGFGGGEIDLADAAAPGPDGGGGNGGGGGGNGNGNGDNGDGSFRITHNESLEVADSSPDSGEPFVGCVADTEVGFVHVATNYFKVFDLAEFGVDGDFEIELFFTGVLDADVFDEEEGGDAVQAQLTFFHQDDTQAPNADQAEEIESFVVNFDPDNDYPTTLAFSFPDDAEIVVPEGRALLLRLLFLDGFNDNNEIVELFNLGVNFEGEARNNFMAAPESDGCSQDITPFDDIEDGDGNNLGNRNWVVGVDGAEL